VAEIAKSFGANPALKSLTLEFTSGEIHSIVGENGAGKSTLVKIIAGVYTADSGVLALHGTPLHITTPHSASAAGIRMVHQESNLVKDLTGLENIFLAMEPRRGWLRTVDWERASGQAEELAAQLEVDVDLNLLARYMTVAEAKMVEILKACVFDFEVLILDEPTAALTEGDARTLFRLLRRLRDDGKTIIYISHRLTETFELCDRVSVLKDGELVGTWMTTELDVDALTTKMVGREIEDIFPDRSAVRDHRDREVLRTEGLSDGRKFFDVSVNVGRGEILGIGGMSGHGQREFIRCLFGLARITSGHIMLEGEVVNLTNPRVAIRHGMAFLSDDRRGEGLAISQPVIRNVGYPSMVERSLGGLLNSRREVAHAISVIESLNVRLASLYQPTGLLSGGNQQRLVLGKWLSTGPKVLLVHEPTLGVDVGAKEEIYRILRSLTEQGLAILMVTSDMLELLHLSDRIVVFYEGRVQAELCGIGCSEEDVMRAAVGTIPQATTG
jgi:ribose transport system ATP-binding protein